MNLINDIKKLKKKAVFNIVLILILVGFVAYQIYTMI
ncbi:hypothetical protein V760_02577 [Staphylococcus aureus F23613]|nr:hypothetical protein V760_02577 [Staphylococcus aureus F23613]